MIFKADISDKLNDKTKMRNKLKLIMSLVSMFFLYWIFILQMAQYYHKEAMLHYQLGSLAYSYRDKIEGKKEGELAESFKRKGNNTLKWLPSLVRAEPME